MNQKTSPRTCSECGKPYGYKNLEVFGRDISGYFPDCNCEGNKAEAEEKRKERIENWRSSQSDLDEKFNLVFIRGRYENVKFERLKTDKQNKETMKLCSDWTNNLSENIEVGNGIALLGPTGTGKTVTMIALHKEILKLEKYTSVMANFTWFLARFTGSPEFWPMVDLLCKADILFIDDLIQGEKFRDFQVRVLYCIADYRWPLARPTIFASNVYGENREKTIELHREYIGNAAVVSRLFSKVTIGILEGRDRR